MAVLPMAVRHRFPPESPTTARQPNWFDWGFAVYAMFVYEGAFVESIRIFAGQEILPGETDRSSTISQIILLSGLIIGLWARRDLVSKVWHDALPVLAIVLVCGLSTSWSEFPIDTFRRTANFATCIGFGIYAYAVFGLPRLVRLVAYCTVVAGVASVATYVGLPSVGREQDPGLGGAMRGVFAQKNSCADTLLLGIVCWIYVGAADVGRRVRSAGAIVLLLGCMILAHSASALIISLIALTTGALIWSGKQPSLTLIIRFLAVFMVLAAVTAITVDPVGTFDLLGRDATLTGRVPLWEYVWQAIAAKPILGYGFYAFWNPNSLSAQYIWKSLDWNAPTAHCGYFDIILQLGIPGVLAYLWAWGSVFTQGAAAVRHEPTAESKWILLFMTTYALINLDEGPLPQPDIFSALTPVCLIFLRSWRRGSFSEARRRPFGASISRQAADRLLRQRRAGPAAP